MQSECQGKATKDSITEKKCPHCGQIVEFFGGDTEVECDNCGQMVFNDAWDCVRWCDKARECVGDEMYEKIMKEQSFEVDDSDVNYYGF